jgi:hypothetical protein
MTSGFKIHKELYNQQMVIDLNTSNVESQQTAIDLNTSKLTFDTASNIKLGSIDLNDIGLSAPVSNLTQTAINRVLHTTSTGLSEGGVISINTVDNSTFDISTGFGYIVNGHTNVEVPTSTKTSWNNLTGISPAYLLTHNGTYVGIDIYGNLFQSSSRFTSTERRNNIELGIVVHPNNTTIFIQNNAPTLNIELGAQVQDILSLLGFRSVTGNRILPTGPSSTMNIKKEAGKLFKPGANFNTLSTQPHFFELPEQSQASFRYRTQTGEESITINAINPGIYDLGGVITAIGATATLASVQQIFIFQEGDIRIQPGQKVYDNLNQAVLAINSETFITEQNIASNGLYLGSICMTRNASNLNNILEVIFVPSQGTTVNGSVTSTPLGYIAENESNKQLSLVPDSVGVKYPTISALQAQSEINSTSDLESNTIGKSIFFTHVGTSININIILSNLYPNHNTYFINLDTGTLNVTFVEGAGTVLRGNNGLVLKPGSTAYLLRRGSTSTVFIDISNPV